MGGSGLRQYVGGFIADNHHYWEWWAGLEELVRDGRPVELQTARRTIPMGVLHHRPVPARPAIQRSRRRVVALGEGATSLLDVAGGHGEFSMALCRRHPDLRATIVDLPGSARIGRSIVAEAGMAERVSYPRATCSRPTRRAPRRGAVLQHRPPPTPESARRLFARIGEALRPGAPLCVLDLFDRPAGQAARHRQHARTLLPPHLGSGHLQRRRGQRLAGRERLRRPAAQDDPRAAGAGDPTRRTRLGGFGVVVEVEDDAVLIELRTRNSIGARSSSSRSSSTGSSSRIERVARPSENLRTEISEVAPIRRPRPRSRPAGRSRRAARSRPRPGPRRAPQRLPRRHGRLDASGSDPLPLGAPPRPRCDRRDLLDRLADLDRVGKRLHADPRRLAAGLRVDLLDPHRDGLQRGETCASWRLVWRPAAPGAGGLELALAADDQSPRGRTDSLSSCANATSRKPMAASTSARR